MSVTEIHDGLPVTIPRQGMRSYPAVAQNVMRMLIARKVRQQCTALRIVRIRHPDSVRDISISFVATHPPMDRLTERKVIGMKSQEER